MRLMGSMKSLGISCSAGDVHFEIQWWVTITKYMNEMCIYLIIKPIEPSQTVVSKVLVVQALAIAVDTCTVEINGKGEGIETGCISCKLRHCSLQRDGLRRRSNVLMCFMSSAT